MITLDSPVVGTVYAIGPNKSFSPPAENVNTDPFGTATPSRAPLFPLNHKLTLRKDPGVLPLTRAS
jgi:hypothetical protein